MRVSRPTDKSNTTASNRKNINASITTNGEPLETRGVKLRVATLSKDVAPTQHIFALESPRCYIGDGETQQVWRSSVGFPREVGHYRPLSRRLDRCDRVIQDEVGDSIRGNA